MNSTVNNQLQKIDFSFNIWKQGYSCITEIFETRELFDADFKYGFRGKQIHNKLANNCKISKNRLSTTT